MLIDGKKIAMEIFEELKKLPLPQKSLAAILVGKNPASLSFLKQKEKAAIALGIKFQLFKFPADINQNGLLKEIQKIAADNEVGGLIIQLPLPKNFDRNQILDAIPKNKDVDALKNSESLALSPVAKTLETILAKIGFDCANKYAVIFGRGFLVGQPVTRWLENKVKNLTVLGSDADPAIIQESLAAADLIVSGVGKPGLIKPNELKNTAVIVDFGYARDENGKIQGDFDATLIDGKNTLLSYTPTPGGTGPILVANLIKNFYELNK